MSFLPGMTGPSSMVPTLPFEFDLIDTNTAFASGTHTFTGIAIGAAPVLGQRRYTVIGLGGADGSPFSLATPTLNGVAMTLVVATNTVRTPGGIWIIETPTGTTADISVNAGSSPGAGVSIVTARLINPSSATPFDTVAAGHSGGIIDLSMDISGGGGAIGLARCINGGASNIWTGLTEGVDYDPSTLDTFTVGIGSKMTAAAPRTIGVQNASGAPNTFLGWGASWAA